MPPLDRPRKTDRPKNYESPFETLENDPRYISLVYLAREAGALETHTLSLLQKIGIPIRRAEAIAQRAYFVSGSRDGYHAFLKSKYEQVLPELQSEVRAIVDLYMRTEVPQKYWRHERGARAIAYILLKQGCPLPVISTALTHHLGGEVKSTTIREVIKLRGVDELLKELKEGVEDDIERTDAQLLVESMQALSTQIKAESRRYRTTWAKDKRYRACVLRMREQGMSAQGIAHTMRTVFRLQIPTVTIKYFINHHHPFPDLDAKESAWVDSHIAGAHDTYKALKQKHFARGAALRYERSLSGDALAAFQALKLRRTQKEEAQLYAEHAPKLRRLARLLDPSHADDLVQESFTRLFTQMRKNKLELWSNVSPYALLATICRNLVKDTYRRPIVRNTTSNEEVVLSFPEQSKSVDEIVSEQRTSLRVRAALLSLSDEHRIIATLKYIEELTEAEIAETLSLPLGTVKSRWRTAATELRKQLQDIDDFSD